MKIFQVFNKKNNAWVKMKQTKKGTEIIDVKEKDPKTPFKRVRRR
jgi:hypothetical protein